MRYYSYWHLAGKVAVLDVDICGPSIPKLLRVENSEIVSTQWGWTPIKYDYTPV